jgi:hypothetical protein
MKCPKTCQKWRGAKSLHERCSRQYFYHHEMSSTEEFVSITKEASDIFKGIEHYTMLHPEEREKIKNELATLVLPLMHDIKKILVDYTSSLSEE